MRFIGTNDDRSVQQSLASYRPKYYELSNVVSEITRVDAIELENLYSAIDDVLNQYFIDTATWSLDRWEKIVGIRTDITKSTDQRRSDIKSRFRQYGASNVGKIQSIIQSYITGTATVTEDNANYRVLAKMAANNPSYLQMMTAVRNTLPAHIDFVPVFISIVQELIMPSELTGINVTRNTWANNGGASSTGKLLDETQGTLNGTWNLDNAGHPDFDVFHSMGLLFTRTTQEMFTPQQNKIIIVNRTTAEQFTTIKNDSLNISRILTMFDGPQPTLLTGTWSMDGSVTMKQSAYPVTIKINGTAV